MHFPFVHSPIPTSLSLAAMSSAPFFLHAEPWHTSIPMSLIVVGAADFFARFIAPPAAATTLSLEPLSAFFLRFFPIVFFAFPPLAFFPDEDDDDEELLDDDDELLDDDELEPRRAFPRPLVSRLRSWKSSEVKESSATDAALHVTESERDSA